MLRADRELTELVDLALAHPAGRDRPRGCAGRRQACAGTGLRGRSAEPGDTALQDRLTAMAMRLRRALPAPIPACHHGAPSPATPWRGELHASTRRSTAASPTSDVVARRDMRHAWELSAAGGSARTGARRRAAGRLRPHRARRPAAAHARRARRGRAPRAARVRAPLPRARPARLRRRRSCSTRTGVVTFAPTPSVEELLGAAPAELIGSPFAELRRGRRARPARRPARRDPRTARRRGQRRARCSLHRLGHPVHAEVRVADRLADPDVDGVRAHACATAAEQPPPAAPAALRRASATRSTGLPNRLRFEEWLDQALAETPGDVRPALPPCCSTSTSSGRSTTRSAHVAGDRLVAAVAERLRGGVAERGRAGAHRLGDEFAVLLEGVSRRRASPSARRAELLDALAEPDPARGRRGAADRTAWASRSRTPGASGRGPAALRRHRAAHRPSGAAPRRSRRHRRRCTSASRAGAGAALRARLRARARRGRRRLPARSSTLASGERDRRARRSRAGRTTASRCRRPTSSASPRRPA